MAKKKIIDAFLKQFALDENDRQILGGRPDGGAKDLENEFFSALDRLSKANADCKLLLASDRNECGLDLAKELTQLLDKSYDTVFQWTQKFTKEFLRDAPDVNPKMRHAMKALKHRSVLFQYFRFSSLNTPFP